MIEWKYYAEAILFEKFMGYLNGGSDRLLVKSGWIFVKETEFIHVYCNIKSYICHRTKILDLNIMQNETV